MAAARTIRRTTLLRADEQRVWAAISTPERLSTWLALDLALDVRPGALGTAEGPQGTSLVRVEAVDERSRVVLSWWPLDRAAPPTRVELAMEAVADGVRLAITETALEDLRDPDGVPAERQAVPGR